MKQIVAIVFGLGLGGNALLFVPQIIAVWRKKTDEGISLVTFGGFSVLQTIGIVHGYFQQDFSLILGMAASLLTCGTVTALTVFYRVRRLRGGSVSVLRTGRGSWRCSSRGKCRRCARVPARSTCHPSPGSLGSAR